MNDTLPDYDQLLSVLKAAVVMHPGDTLVVGLSGGPYPAEGAARMMKQWSALDTGCRLVVMDHVTGFAVLSAE